MKILKSTTPEERALWLEPDGVAEWYGYDEIIARLVADVERLERLTHALERKQNAENET